MWTVYARGESLVPGAQGEGLGTRGAGLAPGGGDHFHKGGLAYTGRLAVAVVPGSTNHAVRYTGEP